MSSKQGSIALPAVALLVVLLASHVVSAEEKVHVFTVATAETDGFLRYKSSLQEYNIESTVLGMGKEWKGGDVKKYPGGGFKLNLLRTALEPLSKDENAIIIFTDSYDVVYTSKLRPIVDKFKSMDTKILLSAEVYCWPNASLSHDYPPVERGVPFVNSGMFMGYAPEVYQLLNTGPIADTDDDQLFFTKAYLDKGTRDKLKIRLDHTSEVFQNLNGALADVHLQFGDNGSYLENVAYGTRPMVVHGNGASKLAINALSNYLANAWDYKQGCKRCQQGMTKLEAKKEPVVVVGLFVEQPTPFLEEQLEKILSLEYPKRKIHIFIHNNVEYHAEVVEQFAKRAVELYASVKQIRPEDKMGEGAARNLALDHCLAKKCDWYFNVDSIAHLDNKFVLKLMVEQNRTVVAPMLTRPGKAWSNFWGALTSDGFYARSYDYMDIVLDEIKGLWNVPFINTCYLVRGSLIKAMDRKTLSYVHETLDPDMSFCRSLREADVFMFVSNRLYFGHLINPETFDLNLSSPDMYQSFENPLDWEQRYIHANYSDVIKADVKPIQPCPDVYWFPVVTKRFCNDLIKMMEDFGEWSDGKNSDPRLSGGYEAVPTRDIHMNQVGWERHWLHFLDKYVRPLQELVFVGYFHQPPNSLMNFVVRYRPDEQPSLRPHHDSSTYTVNIALNTRDVDYTGGGCHFIRYNCSVLDTKPGWMLMHPGRLTHYHEGLKVLSGTRYIMISFVDP